jgi:hypothetical protein
MVVMAVTVVMVAVAVVVMAVAVIVMSMAGVTAMTMMAAVTMPICSESGGGKRAAEGEGSRGN